MTVDSFGSEGRAFYERSKRKLAYSIMMGVGMITLLALVSETWGLSTYTDAIKDHAVDDEMKEAYNALSQGYGFSGFCKFLAFLLMFGGAIYYSPLLCGTHNEYTTILNRREIESGGQDDAVYEDTEGYAESGMDNLIGSVNDAFGAKIEAAFTGEAEEEASKDVIWLLASLALSKLGITLSVGIDWSAFERMFGWVSNISFITVHVADVSPFVVKTVVFAGLLLLQPACVARMNWLSMEHRKVQTMINSLPFFSHTELVPRDSAISPLICVLFTLFFVIFVPSYAMGKHMSSGFAFILIGVPALYLLVVNIARIKIWQYVDVHCAEIVKIHRFEQLCLQEGVYLLFIFVASYTFIMNFFIEYLASWEMLSGADKAFLIMGFMLYSSVPIAYLHSIITAEDADRTFRIFREQLISPFNDKNMYMKLLLLVEAALFSLCMVVFSTGEVGQLTGGFIVAILFCIYSVVARPFDDQLDMATDVLARGSVIFDLFIGLILADNSATSADAASAFLIINSLAGTAWFLYTLDLKDMLLNRFFLLLQMYAQGRAMTYTEKRIPKLSASRVKNIASSPIEFHVLSAVQRIRFATIRKDAFFSGKRIKNLSDLEISWLDLQHSGYDVTSLLALGFTVEELMMVDPQLDDMGDRSDIRSLFESAYVEQKAGKGCGDRDTLAMHHRLGMFYKDMGEYNVSLRTLNECLELKVSHLGVTDADTLLTKQEIGEFYTFLKRSSDAIPLLQECLDAHKEVSATAESTLGAMRALGQALLAAGLVIQARVLLEERLAITIQNALDGNLRRDHPDTLCARLDLGNAYLECGRYREVDGLHLRRVMNRYKTMHGSHSPSTLKLMLEYATLLGKLGHHRDALRLKRDCVDEQTATLGPEHTTTLTSKFALAVTLLEIGKTKELERLNLKEDLAEKETRLGETHPTCISSSIKLGGLYFTMGNFEDALDLFRKVVSLRAQTLGESHELTLNSASNISATLDSMGRTEESKEMYEKTLDLAIESLGETHLVVVGIKINLGQQRQRTGDFEAADKLYNEAMHTACENYGEKHPLTLLAKDSLGCLELVKDKHQEACDIFETVVALRGEVYDESHPCVLATLDNLAACKRQLGKLDESLALYQKACSLRIENYGELHVDTCRSLGGYAVLLADMGHGQQAIPILKKCVSDFRAIVGNEHYLVHEYVGAIGYALATMRRNQEALQYTDLAIEGMGKLYDIDHFQVKRLYQRKAFILQQLNRHAEAQEVMVLAGIELPQPAAAGTDNPMHGHIGLEQAADLMSAIGAMPQQQEQQQGFGALGGIGAALSMLQNLQNIQSMAAVSAQDSYELAKIVWAQGQHENAIQLITRAIEERAVQFGQISEPAIEPIFDRALFFYALDRMDEAQADHVRGLLLMGELQGVSHPETVQSLEAVGKLYTDKGLAFPSPFTGDEEAPPEPTMAGDGSVVKSVDQNKSNTSNIMEEDAPTDENNEV